METKKFKEELIQRSYIYSLKTIELANTLDKKDFVIQILLKQLVRSATSVSANIIEAQAASSKNDFINFLNHGLKSANETIFWLNLVRDSQKLKGNTQLSFLSNESEALAKILGKSITTLKAK